ncbi:hypothetical protein SAY86_026488 [Trapa natans]|uniref:non-specific serine/threonine protein kinase n=1 Tax=Trapa natans TaxID=22666 RepID=A0AAN7KIM6_TRANT|nr:hypothetical protein SAY86_026488 [Trapa natans]
MSTPAPATLPPVNATSPPPPTPSAPPPAKPSPRPPVAPPPPSIQPPPPPPPPAPSTPSPPANASPPLPTLTPASSSPPPPSSPGTPTTGASPPPPPSSSSSSSVSTSLVVGIVIGGVLVLAACSLLLIFCNMKRRRKRRDSYLHSHPPPRQSFKANAPYGGGPPHYRQDAATPPPKWTPPTRQKPPALQNGQGRMLQSPTPQNGQGRMLQPPTPPSPFMNSSSGGSGTNNSGAEGIYHSPSPGIILGFSKSMFSYDELIMATDGFSDTNLLGEGGFGYVHRGVLANGKEVAVKQLKAGSGQGEREFQAEVEIISRLHHKHLVSLVGYCIAGSRRLLVYEFVPNNNLEFHLHGKGGLAMDWTTRLKIALGSAKGLAYLHEDCHPKIIHRDIKAANILLDFRFEAKVADFGLAKITSDANTHVTTRVMGTFGYLAPEYASSGKLTEKSDVFSFGIMLLELITGRRPVDPAQTYMNNSLVDWARPELSRALEDGNFEPLVDPRLQNGYNNDQMARMVACAAASVRLSARRRPKMSQIVRALEGNMSLSDLNEGIRPGQSGSFFGSYHNSDYGTLQYNEDLKKFQKLALSSTETFGINEHSGEASTSYGVNQSGPSSGEGQASPEMEMGKMQSSSSSQGFT